MKKINQEIKACDQEGNEIKIIIGINSWQKKVPIRVISASHDINVISEFKNNKRSPIIITTGVNFELK